jgi:hypothetical protein
MRFFVLPELGQSKISNLGSKILVEKNVGGLYIPIVKSNGVR